MFKNRCWSSSISFIYAMPCLILMVRKERLTNMVTLDYATRQVFKRYPDREAFFFDDEVANYRALEKRQLRSGIHFPSLLKADKKRRVLITRYIPGKNLSEIRNPTVYRNFGEQLRILHEQDGIVHSHLEIQDVLYHKGEFYLVDLVRVNADSPSEELAHFEMSIHLRELLHPLHHAAYAACAEAFVEGYGWHGSVREKGLHRECRQIVSLYWRQGGLSRCKALLLRTFFKWRLSSLFSMVSKRLRRLLVGEHRGDVVMEVFRKYFPDLSQRTVLDVGCGHGSLTISFAKRFKSVYSIDSNEQNVLKTKARTTKENLRNVTVTKENAVSISLTKKKFDVIHLSGVFEWLRAGNPRERARESQELFLKRIGKHMKRNAILYSGTENRGFPYFWIRDPHYNGWPLLPLFPEWLADIIFRLFGKGPYMVRIYSFWTLRRMFRKEFSQVDFYVPIPHYQYVYGFAPVSNRKRLLEECRRVLREYNLDFHQRFSVRWIAFFSFLGLIRFFAPGFITIARK